MGVLYDYFSAPSDEAAAATIDRVGGPGAPSDDRPPLPPFDTIPTRGIDPLTDLRLLEALLTGRVPEESSRTREPLVDSDGHAWVVALSDELQAALAGADGERLGAVAGQWLQIDDLFRHPDPAELASWLGELAALARRSLGRSERLYCWISV
jgi:hypothetical protein